MGSLLERPLIKKDFDEKYSIVIHKMHEMLDEAKVLYDKQVGGGGGGSQFYLCVMYICT